MMLFRVLRSIVAKYRLNNMNLESSIRYLIIYRNVFARRKYNIYSFLAGITRLSNIIDTICPTILIEELMHVKRCCISFKTTWIIKLPGFG